MPKKSDKPRDPTQTVALQVRMKESLRADLEVAARASGRPMNTEIALRLESSIREDELFGPGETRQALIWLASDITEIEKLTGKSWTSDLATFEAVALAASNNIERRRPQPSNYDEAIEFMREINERFAYRDKLFQNLAACGAAKLTYGNALLGRVSGKPYHVVVEDETEWHLPDNPDMPLTDAHRDEVKGWIAEVREIETGAAGYRERLDDLQRPIEDAKQRGREIYEEHRRGFEDMVKRALEQTNGA